MTKTKGLPMPALGRPPSSSWWCVSTREEFMAARDAQLERMTGSEFAHKGRLATGEESIPNRPKARQEFAS